jgi:hypothetical protein
MDSGNNGFFELISAISDDVSKGLLYTHTRLNDNIKKIIESSSFLYALIELLRTGFITPFSGFYTV